MNMKTLLIGLALVASMQVEVLPKHSHMAASKQNNDYDAVEYTKAQLKQARFRIAKEILPPVVGILTLRVLSRKIQSNPARQALINRYNNPEDRANMTDEEQKKAQGYIATNKALLALSGIAGGYFAYKAYNTWDNRDLNKIRQPIF